MTKKYFLSIQSGINFNLFWFFFKKTLNCFVNKRSGILFKTNKKVDFETADSARLGRRRSSFLHSSNPFSSSNFTPKLSHSPTLPGFPSQLLPWGRPTGIPPLLRRALPPPSGALDGRRRRCRRRRCRSRHCSCARLEVSPRNQKRRRCVLGICEFNFFYIVCVWRRKRGEPELLWLTLLLLLWLSFFSVKCGRCGFGREDNAIMNSIRLIGNSDLCGCV